MSKLKNIISLSEPNFNGNEWRYLKECLDSGWVSSAGHFIESFEKGVCRITGAKQSVACINGTAALFMALKIAGVAQGDEVLVPTLTFIAPINAVRYLGADPVFFDCDDFCNLDVVKVIRFITEETVFKKGKTYNKKTGKIIKAVLPVHVFGNAVDLEALIPLARRRNIRIVEDATESLGTIYKAGSLKNKHTGIVGDLGCFSFNGNKIITSGGGGMIVTNHARFAQKTRYLINQAKDDTLSFIHNEVGYNFRMTNLHAALGLAQLQNLAKHIKAKQENYTRYERALAKLPGIRVMPLPDYADNNCWMVALQIDGANRRIGRDDMLRFFNRHGVQARPVWFLNHRQKPFKKFLKYKITKANSLWGKTFNVPCSVGLALKDFDRIISLLKKKLKS